MSLKNGIIDLEVVKQINFGLKLTLSKTLIFCEKRIMVIWILGLSGSGKSTLARNIINKAKKINIIHIDGDLIRNICDKKLGHTLKDRKLMHQEFQN